MRKFCIAFVFAVVLCICPVFAVSDADNSYYAFDPVPDYSLGERALSTLAVSAGWTNTDHEWLNQIRLALTQSGTGSILGYLRSLDSVSDKIFTKLIDIKSSTDYLQNINNNSNSIKTNSDSVVSLLQRDLMGSSIVAELQNSNDIFSRTLFYENDYSMMRHISDQLNWFQPRVYHYLSDEINPDNPNAPTLYHYIKNLSETLASDDDKALSDAQKPNRDQVKQDFVSGTSGKTSLGASDFGDLSSVGGSVKDSISLNGQSSISGFTGGLSDSDLAGQGWFSSSTRDALDTVSPSSSSSSYARRSPDDPYNMVGFSDHYSWLYGG